MQELSTSKSACRLQPLWNQAAQPGWAATGMPTELVWDSTHVPGGEQQARVGFCDRAGNRSFAERQLTLTRPVTPRILSVSPSPFSPNGDGRADTVYPIEIQRAYFRFIYLEPGWEEVLTQEQITGAVLLNDGPWIRDLRDRLGWRVAYVGSRTILLPPQQE